MGIFSSLLGAIPVVGPALSAGLSIGQGVSGLINNARGKGGSSSSSGGGKYEDDPSLDPASVVAPAKGEDPRSIQAGQFNSTVLNGSQEATQSLLGPDVSTILDQYDNAAKAAEEFGPRGGGRALASAQAPFQKVAAYGKLLGGAKTKAADSLAQQGNQKRQADIDLLRTLLSNQQTTRKINYDVDGRDQGNYGDIGSSIGDMLVTVLNGRGKKGPSPVKSSNSAGAVDVGSLGGDSGIG